MSDPIHERTTTAIGDLSGVVRGLHSELVQAEQLRERKIKLIAASLFVLVPSMVLLVIMAVTNFALLSRINDAASDAKSTNQLLYGCFQPGTKCSTENAKNTVIVMNQLRQTQFVIAVCQRRYPIDEDPEGTALVSCVQSYYPSFVLPPRVK